jgi:hypothetical protein
VFAHLDRAHRVRTPARRFADQCRPLQVLEVVGELFAPGKGRATRQNLYRNLHFVR